MAAWIWSRNPGKMEFVDVENLEAESRKCGVGAEARAVVVSRAETLEVEPRESGVGAETGAREGGGAARESKQLRELPR